MTPTNPQSPAGADLTELCTSPSPTGRTCLQQLRDGRTTPVCDGCQELLAQLLASVMEER